MGVFVLNGLSLTFVIIVVGGMETSATMRWSPDAVPSPCFAECGWGGCNGHANRDQGPRRQFKFSNLFACPLNPLTPHSATQWGEECSGVNPVPLVSMLQTHSLRMFVLKSIKLKEYFCLLSQIFFFLQSAPPPPPARFYTHCNYTQHICSIQTVHAEIIKSYYSSPSNILFIKK